MKRYLLLLAASIAALAVVLPATAGAATFRGAVVAKDAARKALVTASSDGTVRTVRLHAKFNRFRVGSTVVVRGAKLPDGTYSAAAVRRLGKARGTHVRGDGRPPARRAARDVGRRQRLRAAPHRQAGRRPRALASSRATRSTVTSTSRAARPKPATATSTRSATTASSCSRASTCPPATTGRSSSRSSTAAGSSSPFRTTSTVPDLHGRRRGRAGRDRRGRRHLHPRQGRERERPGERRRRQGRHRQGAVLGPGRPERDRRRRRSTTAARWTSARSSSRFPGSSARSASTASRSRFRDGPSRCAARSSPAAST